MNAHEADLVQQWEAADIARQARADDYYVVSDESVDGFHQNRKSNKQR